MKTRMEKYYDNNINTPLREQKNVELYQNINNYEVDDYKLESNATVIDHDVQNIDVEKIKKILDTKYNKEPKRRSIVIEEENEPHNIEFDDTKEYDINAILEKARSEKEDNYEHERLKKIRDTQYDILNSLDIEDKNKDEEETKKEEELVSLINTITMHEIDSKKENPDSNENIDPLDILTDLKGDDNTVVVGGATEEESINETSPIMSLEEAEIAKKEALKENKTNDLTNTLAFTQSDFDDFNDLKKDVKSSRILIYIVIALVTLVIIGGIVIFLNKFLNIGLF